MSSDPYRELTLAAGIFQRLKPAKGLLSRATLLVLVIYAVGFLLIGMIAEGFAPGKIDLWSFVLYFTLGVMFYMGAYFFVVVLMLFIFSYDAAQPEIQREITRNNANEH